MAAGLAIGAVAALTLPWLKLDVQKSRTAWDLDLYVPHLPWLAHVSYGAVLAVALAIELIRWVKGGWRGPGLGIGFTLVVTAVAFVVITRLADSGLAATTVSDADSYHALINISGEASLAPNYPTDVLGHSMDPTTVSVLAHLGPGWYAAVIVGLCATVAHKRRRAEPAPASTRLLSVPEPGLRYGQAGLAAAVGLAAVVAALVGWLADSDRSAAINAAARGDGPQAERLLANSVAWNPAMADDQGWVVTRGIADCQTGQTRTAYSDYARAVLLSYQTSNPLPLTFYQRALVRDPANPVFASGLNDYLLKDPTVYTGPVPTTGAGSGEVVGELISVAQGELDDRAYQRAIATYGRLNQIVFSNELRSYFTSMIALAEARLGDVSQFRASILAAYRLDSQLANPYADELSAGLFSPGSA